MSILKEHDEGEEAKAGDTENDRGEERCRAPAKAADHVTTEEEHHEEVEIKDKQLIE